MFCNFFRPLPGEVPESSSRQVWSPFQGECEDSIELDDDNLKPSRSCFLLKQQRDQPLAGCPVHAQEVALLSTLPDSRSYRCIEKIATAGEWSQSGRDSHLDLQ